MDPIHIIRHGPYIFGSLVLLSEGQLNQIRFNIKTPLAAEGQTVLGGRRPLIHTQLDGIGSVVIKTYGRGGIIRHINKQWYMRLGKPRCQMEFENILNAKSLGIGVPEPIAFVYTRGLLYHAWLITREIRGHQTLAMLSITDEKRTKVIMGKVIKQLGLAIDTGIHHIDFHPGNILVTPEGEIYIVDFDKAYQYKGKKDSLKKKYIERWERAVNKHGLPELLCEGLKEKL